MATTDRRIQLEPKLEVDYILTLSVIGLGFTLYNIFVAPSVARFTGNL
jgi:hypothetical protein